MTNDGRPTDYNQYCEFALALAKECGQLARKHYTPDIRFEPKGDTSPLTAADTAINRHVIERCQAAYPGIGVMGEEESADGSHGRLLWVCDPIDGTNPYVLGMAASTFCLALVEDGVPVVGVVYDFVNDRLYHAVKGAGAYLNGEALTRPDYPAMKMVNFEWWHGAVVEASGFHEAMFAKGYQVPNFTSTGLMSMQTALGRIAGVVYMGGHAWDVAAAKVIAEEAGCKVTNVDGDDQRYDQAVRGAIIARPEHYETVLQVLANSSSHLRTTS